MSDADCTPGHEPRSVAASFGLAFCVFLGSPYVIGQTIIFLLCGFFFLLFFPRLISAAVDWMSTILRHMVWR